MNNGEWKQVGSGGLWSNEKRTSDTQPDFTGRFELEGAGVIRLAAWIREKDGRRYLSVVGSQRVEDAGADAEQAASSAGSVWDRLSTAGSQAARSAVAPAVGEQCRSTNDGSTVGDAGGYDAGDSGGDDLPF